MTKLSNHVQTYTAGITVYRYNREEAKWWNARRVKNEPSIFVGWYWNYRGRENGPFPSQSAARRDAYYREILKQEPPYPNSNNVVLFKDWKKQA